MTLISLFDSCHSGTMMNLPFNALFGHTSEYTSGGSSYGTGTEPVGTGNFIRWKEEYPNEPVHKLVGSGFALQFSASRHNQYAKEITTPAGVNYTGAATHAFCTAVIGHREHWGPGKKMM